MRVNILFAAICLTLCLAFAPVAQAETIASPSAPAAPVTSPAQAGKPTEVIKAFYTQLVDTMKQGDQLGFSGRYKKLEPAVRTAFNLPLMTRFAVGFEWSNATPEEQKELTSAFSDFSVATYASQFKKYDGEAFQITGEKPTADGVIVETKLVPKEGEPVALNYMMKTDEQGQWRIVDVYLDGAISQLAAQRSQFVSIVRRDGIAALVNSLGDKAKQMGPASAPASGPS